MESPIIGQNYFLEYSERQPTHKWKGSNTVSRTATFDFHGTYEFIRCNGSKFHFYSDSLGKDILITKTDFNKIKPLSIDE